MNRTTLIRNVTAILPTGRQLTNVLIADGRIQAVDASETTSADEIVDGTDHVLFPGVVDDQVHFREPGLTHKEDLTTASQACAAGGVTSFLEMPNTKPAATTLELLEEKYLRASQVSCVNYGFYIGASCTNLNELKRPANIPGIKIFIGSSTGDLLVDDQSALEAIFAETNYPICAHCEDETTVRQNQARLGDSLTIHHHSQIRDVQAAVIATRRALDLAVRHKHRFHVLHVSTAAEIPLLEPARPWVTAEVCPHHLFFNVDDYDRLGSLIQMNPSIKTEADNQALWNALKSGQIQVIATDHAPHTLEEKSRAYPQSPSGLPAVENSLALMLDRAYRGRCSWEQIASWMCDAPARVWGLVGKGRIAVGYDADLVLVDPMLKKVVHNDEQFTKTKWSPWHGQELAGWPVQTWVHGQTVFRNGKITPNHLGRRVQCDHARGGYWSTPDGIGI